MKKLQFNENDVWNDQDDKISVLNFFDCHVGEEGYFSDYPDFSTYSKRKLTGIQINKNSITYVGDDNYLSLYFILADKAKKVEEPEYRPFEHLDELPFKLGDTVRIRLKDKPSKISCKLVTGIQLNEAGYIATITLDSTMLTPISLLDIYEYSKVCWKPFGVKNESNKQISL